MLQHFLTLFLYWIILLDHLKVFVVFCINCACSCLCDLYNFSFYTVSISNQNICLNEHFTLTKLPLLCLIIVSKLLCFWKLEIYSNIIIRFWWWYSNIFVVFSAVIDITTVILIVQSTKCISHQMFPEIHFEWASHPRPPRNNKAILYNTVSVL